MNKGTHVTQFELPFPWPPHNDIILVIKNEENFNIKFLSSGKIKIERIVKGEIYSQFVSCKILYEGTGLITLIIVWEDQDIILYINKKRIPSDNHSTHIIKTISNFFQPNNIFKYVNTKNIMDKNELLFCQHYNELINFMETNDDYKALKSSAILRQMFYDGTPFIHRISQIFSKKIRFIVKSNYNVKISHQIQSGFNTLTPLPYNNPATTSLTLTSFSNAKIITVNDIEFSVREVVKLFANTKGGVHISTADEKQQILLEVDDYKINVIPLLQLALKDITHVSLNMMTEFILEIKNKYQYDDFFDSSR